MLRRDNRMSFFSPRLCKVYLGKQLICQPQCHIGCDRASTVLQSTNRAKHSSSTRCSCELLDQLKLFKLHCSLRLSWSFEQSKQFKIL